MERRIPWLVGGAVLVVVLGLLAWRGCRQDYASTPADFTSDGVKLVSPDLDLALVSVAGVASDHLTDWSCRFECREKKGCRADVTAIVHYRSQGRKQTLKLVGRFDGGAGDVMWLGRAQRPPEIVDRVDRVVLEVVAPFDPAAPLPTPMQ